MILDELAPVMLISPVNSPVLGRGHAPSIQGDQAPQAKREAMEPKHAQQKWGVRLTFDRELKRSFVEFLSPDTGEVVARFPNKGLGQHVDSVV